MFYGGRDAVLTVEIALRNPAILGQGADHGLVLSWEDAHAEALDAVASELGRTRTGYRRMTISISRCSTGPTRPAPLPRRR